MTDFMNKYYVIVPVFNEQKHIKKFLVKLKKYTKNIIVVNDGSSDKTKEILDTEKSLTVINLDKNQGKGAAMKVGAKTAWKLNANGIIFMDGDNQHDARHLPEFIDLLNKSKDIIIGVRVLKGHIPLVRRIGNEIFILLMKRLFNTQIPDILCGFRAFSKKGYSKIVWKSEDYGVEAEVVTLIGKKNLKYSTLVVDTIYHDRYKGFSVTDGLKILLRLPYWKFRK